jgi:threonine dehydratase
MPVTTPQIKVAAVRALGADVVLEGDSYDDAQEKAVRIGKRRSLTFVHPYDDPDVIAGQGTIAMEMLRQFREPIDAIFVAVGGGGLIGGIAAWYAGKVRIIGVEPVLAPTLSKALEAGKPVDAPAGGIAADSLAPKQVGQLMFPLAQKYVEKVVLVEDDAILASQKALWDQLRITAEAGGAAAYAALLSKAYRPGKDERVGVLVCGGNTTAVNFEK